MINGLSMLNGLSMINGLNALNGLSSTYGLANGVGLMSSAGGRSTLSYIVRCALPAGHRITKNDQQNISYTFQGEIGVAPEWETGALSDQLSGGGQRLPPRARQHQRAITSQLWLDGDSPLSAGARARTTRTKRARSSGTSSRVRRRLTSATERTSTRAWCRAAWAPASPERPTPTRSATGATARITAPPPTFPNNNDGYKSCAGFNHVVTVWRNFDPNTDYKVCARSSGKCLDVQGASTARRCAADPVLHEQPGQPEVAHHSGFARASTTSRT